MRSLTPAMIAALQARVVRPIWMVQADFPSATLRYWTGRGEKTWNGNIWYGSGDLIKVSRLEQTRELRAAQTQFELSGVDNSGGLLDVALSEEYQGRAIYTYFGLLDDAGNIIADPILYFRGIMDQMTPNVQPDSLGIKLVAENMIRRFEIAKNRTYTPSDQQAEFSTDTFFNFVAEVQDKTFNWGRS